MKKSSLRGKLILLLFSIFLVVLVLEVLGRVSGDRFTRASASAVDEIDWIRERGDMFEDEYVLDKEVGFRPKLGTNLYNKYGTKVNNYDIKDREGRERVLFLGDSVTNREKIVFALRRNFGEQNFEYWNAGVESYNTTQEVKFYEKFNYKLKPDHVVLTFHLNDFESTPMVFREGDKYVAYAPNMPTRKMNKFLFRNSFIYRTIKNVQFSRSMSASQDEIVDEVRDNLVRLRDRLSDDGIKFTVLVLPYFYNNLDDWRIGDEKSREKILGILSDIEVRFFDLYPIYLDFIKEGGDVQESPGDSWHPNQKIADDFGDYLYNKNLL